MSNHTHICISTERLGEFIKTFRYAYSRYFNSRYKRYGRLGERQFFVLEIEGIHHLLTAIAYVLRNPLHHGICSTPFEYEFSSAKAAFKKELGFSTDFNMMPRHKKYRYIPEKNHLNDSVKMNIDGLILPESIIDTADIEHQFSSARSYLYYMNRLSGENWEKEQNEDRLNIPPIKISDVEKGVKYTDITNLLSNEHGRASYRRATDINLCEEIDSVIVPKLGKSSIYQLSSKEIAEISDLLRSKHHLSEEQVTRCLGGESRNR